MVSVMTGLSGSVQRIRTFSVFLFKRNVFQQYSWIISHQNTVFFLLYLTHIDVTWQMNIPKGETLINSIVQHTAGKTCLWLGGIEFLGLLHFLPLDMLIPIRSLFPGKLLYCINTHQQSNRLYSHTLANDSYNLFFITKKLFNNIQTICLLCLRKVFPSPQLN